LSAAEPLSAEDFKASMAALGAPTRVIVAVSGGPDSMALARLAAQACENALAVTVDHGLRAGARAEAEKAGEWCRAAGLDHRILTWEGEKPAAGVQAAARAARYRLLASLAEAEGYGAILTAHTADDQAETVFMRLARGAGVAGLSGMEARSLIAAGAGEPTLLLRPLLGFSRARIIATLKSLEQDFVEDPSNDDPGFERVRTRALLAALAEEGLLSAEALTRTAERLRRARERLEEDENDAFYAAGGAFSAHGVISLRSSEAGLPPGLMSRPSLLARLARAVGGGDHPPAEEVAASAFDALERGGAASLGGAIARRVRGRLLLYREPAALLGRAGVPPLAPVKLPAGGRLLWDARFAISNETGDAVSIAPFGEGEEARSAAEAEGLPASALAAAPAVIEGDGGPYRLASRAPGLKVASLAEERFFGRILRFA